MRISYTFDEVKVARTAKTKDGKRRQRTFSQTINPFNKNKNGKVKTRGEIHLELHKEADAWASKVAKTNAADLD